MTKLLAKLFCLLSGHVGGGVYLGYHVDADAMRRSCLRCHRAFVEAWDER